MCAISSQSSLVLQLLLNEPGIQFILDDEGGRYLVTSTSRQKRLLK